MKQTKTNMSNNRKAEHNRELRRTAEYRACEMMMFPSKLEERMMEFLDCHNISYEVQKIFYIYAEDEWIIRYYIADFYIPDKHLIIEVDGKFHDKQKQKDKNRTKDIQEQYPDVEVLRYTWNDMNDEYTMDDLLWKLT